MKPAMSEENHTVNSRSSPPSFNLDGSFSEVDELLGVYSANKWRMASLAVGRVELENQGGQNAEEGGTTAWRSWIKAGGGGRRASRSKTCSPRWTGITAVAPAQTGARAMPKPHSTPMSSMINNSQGCPPGGGNCF